jgi:hypothetical protein
MDEIPSNIQETADELVSNYTEGSQLQDIKNVIVDKFINGRREEYVTTLETLNNNENKE